MNAPSILLLESLGLLGVAMVRFSVTCSRQAPDHTKPQATDVDQPESLRPFPDFSVTAFFTAFALPPLKGTYTLYVAEGKICYDPPAPAGRLATAARPSRKMAALIQKTRAVDG